jgi:hypothetical protein
MQIEDIEEEEKKENWVSQCSEQTVALCGNAELVTSFDRDEASQQDFCPQGPRHAKTHTPTVPLPATAALPAEKEFTYKKKIYNVTI